MNNHTFEYRYRYVYNSIYIYNYIYIYTYINIIYTYLGQPPQLVVMLTHGHVLRKTTSRIRLDLMSNTKVSELRNKLAEAMGKGWRWSKSRDYSYGVCIELYRRLPKMKCIPKCLLYNRHPYSN